MPVISATQETEAGESLEPRKGSLKWAKIVPLHSSLGNRARRRVKKRKISLHQGRMEVASYESSQTQGIQSHSVTPYPKGHK